MRTRNIFIALCIACSLAVAEAQNPATISLNEWSFSHDNVNWEKVNVPHDWAIAGPFDKKWDLQVVAIEQNGETEATEKSGRSGSLPWIGTGSYKTDVTLPIAPQYAELQFDGAMSEPTVYVNGSKAGYWAYGYNAFRLDVTPLLKAGKNEIRVDLQNVDESSRWYPGAGLYRPVTLAIKNKTHIDEWSTFVYTKEASADKAVMGVRTKVVGDTGGATVSLAIKSADGEVVGALDKSASLAGEEATIEIAKPQLWSPENPYLYTLEVTVKKGGTTVDAQTVRCGARTISVDKENGFRLNGVARKIKGVCLHHDLGPLGAAVNKAALIRQVKILKDMGCDAIRTSHNMPSTMQMEVYDSLGMMVMAESFDMWIYPKCKNGYARFFNDWAEKDVTNLVLNHRNHPSVVMWSIGNEIPEQWSQEGVEIATRLQNLCHELDPTRPVTQGLDRVDDALASGFAQVMDIPGLNYRCHKYLKAYETTSHGFILGSETASTVSSRGVYKFPPTVQPSATYDDGQCNGYDTEYCWWSNLPEVDFALQEDYPWTIGQFVWTGFDYLGEPTPYDEYWPSRSSYFGICDLAGLPKDRYYLYRSVWNTDDHTVHLLPHWSWKGCEGQVIPVYCYTDGVEGELFINGKSQGRVRKDLSKHIQDIDPDSVNVQPLLDRYRLRWNDVVYEPGELKVIVYDENGAEIGEDVRYTPTEAVALSFASDRESLRPDGNDLCYVTISLVDENGVEIPDADDQLEFEVTGAGTFRAACNGDATSLEPFTEPRMRLFAGKAVVTLQSATTEGDISLTVRDKSKNLEGTFSVAVTAH